ncbi:MAG: Protease subunit of ATP-dependent protease [Elusimicrobia bacterium]|nr:MAG: Protease subunit of ATP-dependent protease [Elusimicrobiota bacterium]KAF0152715.1 MAG: Protease subunit of ATP-dependent protease [Elusimicrobiota bacterium]
MRHLTMLLVLTLCAAPAFSQAKPADNAKPQTKTQQLNEERDELKAQYDLLMQRQKNKLADMEAELGRLSAENKLEAERQSAALRKLKDEIEKLATDNKLSDEKLKAETALKNSEFQRISLENKLAAEASKKELEAMTASILKIKAENELLSEQQKKLILADSAEKMAIDLEIKKMDLRERQLKFEKLTLESRMDQLNSDLVLRTRKEEWKKEANKDPVYEDQPFKKGVLTVSDRRIPLNGPVYSRSADYITDRIHYFNNISTAPIFLVIDNSPGGSVMAGYRILKAMESSKAPVYVVVKSYAASMAAGIATLAKKSFAYPNAIILHHQMSTMNWGNMTQIKEQYEKAKEWERRILEPVAKKMGISTEAFRKRMYEKSSDGDWDEFADKAVALKWVDNIVDRIDETGFVKNPDYAQPSPANRMEFTGLEEKTDDTGRRYVNLPRLEPFDFYFIHNPDKYYR